MNANQQVSRARALSCALAVVVGFGFLLGAVSESPAVGEAGAQFLKIPIGPKACAMGEAFAAVADDASCLHWNPAGLSRLHSQQIMVMHIPWLEGMSCQCISAAKEFSFGSMGLALSYSSSGDIPGYDEGFHPTTDYTAYDAWGMMAFAQTFPGIGALGLGAKFIDQKIEEESAFGCALDLGLLVEKTGLDGLSCGLSVQNIGPSLKFVRQADPLPLIARLGLAYTHKPVTVATDLYKQRFSDWQLHCGLELRPVRPLAMRGGYLTRPDAGPAFRLGFAATVRWLSFEYAYLPHDNLNDAHCLACTLSW